MEKRGGQRGEVTKGTDFQSQDNRVLGRTAMHSIMTTVYLKVAKRVDLKRFHHKKIFLSMDGDRC